MLRGGRPILRVCAKTILHKNGFTNCLSGHRPSGKGSAFPALSPVTRRLLRLPDIPETVRADLRTLDRRSAVSGFHRQSTHPQNRFPLDRLYPRVIDDLDKLMAAVGLKAV